MANHLGLVFYFKAAEVLPISREASVAGAADHLPRYASEVLSHKSQMDPHCLDLHYSFGPIYTRGTSKTGEGYHAVGVHWGL